MKARKAMKVLVAVALVMALATPALANWQSLGWAFFGLAAANSVVAATRPPAPVYVTPAPVVVAPAPVYVVPPPPPPVVYYPPGYYHRRGPHGYCR